MAFILRVHLPFLRFSGKEWSKIGHFYKKIIIFVNFCLIFGHFVKTQYKKMQTKVF